MCLLANNNPISNVLTVPAAWSRTEEDQWKFGENLWRESASKALAEWNSFCVALDVEEGAASKMKYELLLELCITVRRSVSTSPPAQPQRTVPEEEAAAHSLSSSPMPSEIEMSCGWTKLEIHSANSNVADGINRGHRLKINGGSFQCESEIKESDIRNDRRTSISFRKLKQRLSGLESTLRIQEQSGNALRGSDRQFMQWLPPHAVTPLSSCKLIAMHYELTADRWLRDRNRPSFRHHFRRQNLFRSLFLFVVDRPNLLCVLIDQWKLKRDSLWRSQRKDRRMMTLQFKALLKQFVPLLLHHKVAASDHDDDDDAQHHIDRDTLHPDTLSFVRRVVEGNVEHILCGNKQAISPSTPLVYAPFDADLLVCG